MAWSPFQFSFLKLWFSTDIITVCRLVKLLRATLIPFCIPCIYPVDKIFQHILRDSKTFPCVFEVKHTGHLGGLEAPRAGKRLRVESSRIGQTTNCLFLPRKLNDTPFCHRTHLTHDKRVQTFPASSDDARRAEASQRDDKKVPAIFSESVGQGPLIGEWNRGILKLSSRSNFLH